VQFGNLPTFFVRVDSREASPKIAYFRLSAFFDPVTVMPAFAKAVKDHLDADGFIIDLRGNPGGIGYMAVGMGNRFVDRVETMGTMTTRTGTLKYVLNPGVETFRGPLAILVDGCSASTSEIFAGGMRDIKRARIFGSRTAGAALPSSIERLPNGDGFQYAFADYVSAGGKRLEGNGVQPDVEVLPDRSQLLAGHDPVLDAAIAWIRSQKDKEREQHGAKVNH
jgi:carboxyl-terminal processing protease